LIDYFVLCKVTDTALWLWCFCRWWYSEALGYKTVSETHVCCWQHV